MDLKRKTRFEELFAKYFPGADLPLTFYYADEPPQGVKAAPPSEANELTFAAPMKKFARMIANLEESFVITRSWEKVARRMANQVRE